VKSSCEFGIEPSVRFELLFHPLMYPGYPCNKPEVFSFAVSLGGIAGLFIGFSLLSGVELIYYLTFRLYGLWRTERRSKVAPRTKSLKVKENRPSQPNVPRPRKLQDASKPLQKTKTVLPQQYY
jgi:hypothetical protein